MARRAGVWVFSMSLLHGSRVAGWIGRSSLRLGGVCGVCSSVGILGRHEVYSVRLILWWSEKADRVIDGRAWDRGVGLGVFRRKKLSMEEEAGREGGSKGGQEGGG